MSPNGDELLDDLKLEKVIKNWTEPEKFLARTIMDVKRTCDERQFCSPSIQLSKKQIALGTGTVGIISTIVSLIFELLSK